MAERATAAANGLPLEFFVRVIWQESRFQPNAVGPTTRSGHRAQGIAQFMPYTATQRGLLDPFNPETAIPEAAEFLAELRSEFGNLGLAAAAYNAGPGRVRDFIGRRGGMPAQTRHYVRAITGRSVDEWAARGREGGKDGILKPTSCRQLAALLKEQPSFLIGKVEGNVHEPALRRQGIPDGRNAFLWSERDERRGCGSDRKRCCPQSAGSHRVIADPRRGHPATQYKPVGLLRGVQTLISHASEVS